MEELKLNLELNLIPFGRLIWVDLQLHQFYVACDHLFLDEVVVQFPRIDVSLLLLGGVGSLDLSGVGGLDLYNTEIIWNSEPLGLCKSLIV